MHTLTYVTSNKIKFDTATLICAPLGVNLQQATADVPEMQGNDGEIIARDKAQRAYDILQRPIIISDDSWSIPGLKGFPGPYMKYMNEWLTEEDWLRLVKPLEDRRIVLRQVIVYQDANGQHTFHTDVEGVLLRKPHGASHFPHLTLASFDNGTTSIAEAIEKSGSALATANRTSSWHALCEWVNGRDA